MSLKVFHAKTDVGFKPGLKMGVVFAEELHTTRHTWAPYVEVRDPKRLVSC